MLPSCPACGVPARSVSQVNAAIRRLIAGARGRGLTVDEAAEYRDLLAEWSAARRAEGAPVEWVRAA